MKQNEKIPTCTRHLRKRLAEEGHRDTTQQEGDTPERKRIKLMDSEERHELLKRDAMEWEEDAEETIYNAKGEKRCREGEPVATKKSLSTGYREYPSNVNYTLQHQRFYKTEDFRRDPYGLDEFLFMAKMSKTQKRALPLASYGSMHAGSTED